MELPIPAFERSLIFIVGRLIRFVTQRIFFKLIQFTFGDHYHTTVPMVNLHPFLVPDQTKNFLSSLNRTNNFSHNVSCYGIP